MSNHGKINHRFGLPRHNPRELELAAQGVHPDHPEEMQATDYSPSDQSVNDREYQRWKNIAHTALMPFPALEPHEQLTTKDLKERILQIDKAGYSISSHMPTSGHFSNFNRAQLSGMLNRIVADVTRQVQSKYPTLYAEVDAKRKKIDSERQTLR